MLPWLIVTNSEKAICFIIIREECKQKVLILKFNEKFIGLFIGHMRFNMVNSKHRHPNDTRVVVTFYENLSDEKLPEMKRTFLFFRSVKSLVTCNKMNHEFSSFFCVLCSLMCGSALVLKLYLENRLSSKPSSEKWFSECTSFEWEANW